MPSKKVSSADNQQERPEIAWWISGFVDGEGCFSVSINRNSTTRFGWQVFPEFVVTQGEKSRSSLEVLKKHFGCGSIYINRRHDNHSEALLRYCVRNRTELAERIIPFFNAYPLKTAKKDDFVIFIKIIDKMNQGKHLTKEGLANIARLIQTMNRKVPSRFLESSETKRRIPT